MSTKKAIKGIECRFATHIRKNYQNPMDVHLIKEIVHYKDGTIEPKLKLIKDYKRPFWVTKKNKQKYQDKKEWSRIEELDKYEATQSDLTKKIQQVLKVPGRPKGLKELSESPYLYGAEITSTSLIKARYQQQWPELNTEYSVAAIDTETLAVPGDSGPIFIVTVAYKNENLTCAWADWLVGHKALGNKSKQELDVLFKQRVCELLGDKIKQEEGDTVELYIGENIIDIIRYAFDWVHKRMPDILALWNQA